MSKRPLRNTSTSEARRFWANVSRVAAEARKWPAWKRAAGRLAVNGYKEKG